MTTHRRLRTFFRTVAASSLAASSAGCPGWLGNDGGDGVLPPYDRSGFTTDACAETTLAPAAGTDFIARRIHFLDAFSSDGGVLETQQETLFGAPCATATDVFSCAQALGAIPTDIGFSIHQGSALEQFVFTRGDDVGAATTLAELRALLGTIDTAAEARLMLERTQAVFVRCGETNARFVEDGIEIVGSSGTACGTDRYESIVLVRPDGTTEIVDTRLVELRIPDCVVGRVTAGAIPRLRPAPRSVGERLAQMASLEAAAIAAFTRLADEMKAFGAPASLVRRALLAARDEARHVRMVAAEARRFGASPARFEASTLPRRGPLEVALENAREGMVRETYGALAATYHAGAAKDRSIARTFARIAEDETRHAALSMDFGRWLEPRLAPEEQALVARAREDAAQTLADVVAVELETDVHETLGWPRPEVARELVAQAFPAAWG